MRAWLRDAIKGEVMEEKDMRAEEQAAQEENHAREEGKRTERHALAALLIELICPVAILLAGFSISFGSVIGSLLFLVFALFALAAPVVGIAYGIATLCMKWRTGKSVALSTVAIAAPILITLVLILLFSTGALVVRFM